MSKKDSVQVSKDHYEKTYDDLPRFISYFSQIDTIRKLGCKNILEIGIGNRTVSNYLKHNGSSVTTCDISEDLKPDHVGDIRNLPFEDLSFDLVMACEVLEHLPWDDIDKAMSELDRVTKKYVLISLPYSNISFEFISKFPYIARLFRRPFFKLLLRIPCFYKTHHFDGEHYWVVGRKNYSLNSVKKRICKRFRIINEFSPVLNPGHYFFVLEKEI